MAVPVSAAAKVEHAGTKSEAGGTATAAPTKASPRRSLTLPLGTRSDRCVWSTPHVAMTARQKALFHVSTCLQCDGSHKANRTDLQHGTA